jgi:hypothetical protein
MGVSYVLGSCIHFSLYNRSFPVDVHWYFERLDLLNDFSISFHVYLQVTISCLLRLGLKRLVQLGICTQNLNCLMLKGSFYSYWEQSPMYSYVSCVFMLTEVFCYTFIGKVDVIESSSNCGKCSNKEEVVDQ